MEINPDGNALRIMNNKQTFTGEPHQPHQSRRNLGGLNPGSPLEEGKPIPCSSAEYAGPFAGVKAWMARQKASKDKLASLGLSAVIAYG